MRKLRVLIVDQMGVLQSERRKYEALAQSEDLEITVLVPQTWCYNYLLTDCEPVNSDLYSLIRLPVSAPGYGHRSFYRSSLSHLFRTVRPDVIHIFQEPYSLFAGQLTLARNLFCRSARIIFISWHNIYFDRYHYKGAALHHAVERFVYRNASCATPVTHSADEVLKKRGFTKPTQVLNWGVDLNRFKKLDVRELRDKLQLAGQFVVGYVGRFVEEKGVLDLIKAGARLSDNISLLLVGDGPLKSRIQTLAEKSDIKQRLVMVSSVSNSEMAPYINCMDVLVLPSRDGEYWHEQLGKVLLEAMACEVAVIGSDSGEIPNVIGDKDFVVPQGDIIALAQRITDIKSKPTAIGKKTQAARHRVEQIYNWQSIAKDLSGLYRRLSAS